MTAYGKAISLRKEIEGTPQCCGIEAAPVVQDQTRPQVQVAVLRFDDALRAVARRKTARQARGTQGT
jgi:hypothetical protein